MKTLLETAHTRKNEEAHRVSIKLAFAEWLKTMTRRERRALSTELHMLLAKRLEQRSWEAQNLEATRLEAQLRANDAKENFVLFEIGSGLFGIIPADSFIATYGRIIVVVRPQ